MSLEQHAQIIIDITEVDRICAWQCGRLIWFLLG